MKYKLNKPELNSADFTKINKLSNYMGWTFKFCVQKKTALIETIEKEVGYIQQDECGKIFIVWKHNEEIEYVDHLYNIAYQYDVLLSNINNKRNVFTFLIDILWMKKSLVMMNS